MWLTKCGICFKENSLKPQFNKQIKIADPQYESTKYIREPTTQAFVTTITPRLQILLN